MASGNLPIEVSSFVGRESELTRLLEQSSRTHLLTLVGPGGVGKTRLAIRLGATRREAFGDGVWIVDVSALSDPRLVSERIADTLGLRKRGPQTWQSLLGGGLRTRQLLLIIDTCEHQLRACAEVVSVLLRDSPGVHVLATSRQRLGVAGEVVWQVQPLSLPAADATTAQQLRTSEACQLFTARFRETLPGFALTDENATLVGRLCHKVAGMPLAIELIAAHAATLGLTEVDERITTDMALDLTGARDAPARQLSLRATFFWSYDHLSALEQLLLRRLSVFVGGWTADALRSVCADHQLSTMQVSAALDGLIVKSMVVTSARSDAARQELLMVTRQLAVGLLGASGEAEQICWRFVDWSRGLAELAPPEALDPSHVAALEREEDNLRAALGWSVSHGWVEAGLRIAVGMFPLWLFRSRLVEGRTWIERLLAVSHTPITPDLLTRAHACRAELMLLQGEYPLAAPELQAIVADQRARGDRGGAGVTLALLSNVALWRGALRDALRFVDESLGELHGLSNPIEDVVVIHKAVIAWQTRDVATARELADTLLSIVDARPRTIALARAQQIAALVTADEGDTGSALRRLDEAVARHREVPDQNGLVDAQWDRGKVLLDSGDAIAAHAAFLESVRLANQAGLRFRLVRGFEGLACTLVTSQPELAVQLIAAATESRSAMGTQRWPRDGTLVEASLRMARISLGAAEFARAWRIGTLTMESEAASLALASSAPRRPHRGRPTLTRREQEVLRLFAKGRSTRQIAEQLVLSLATVRTHLDRASAKLGLHSRVHLANWAATADNLRVADQA